MMGYWDYGYGPAGMGDFGGVFMLVFWGLIIWLIVSLIRGSRPFEGISRSEFRKTPLDILKERYAKGEMDKKEFEEKKKDIIA